MEDNTTQSDTQKPVTDVADAVVVPTQESESRLEDIGKEVSTEEAEAPVEVAEQLTQTEDIAEIEPKDQVEEPLEVSDVEISEVDKPVVTAEQSAEEAQEIAEELTENGELEAMVSPDGTKSHFNLNSTNKQTGVRGWYVIHTYAGYEEQVAEALKQRIDSLNMGESIYDVIVPKEKQIEIKNGKRKVVEKRIFPGYAIVDMVVTDYSWYVVRNTPNVTGFIGLGVRPTPMAQEEIDRIKKRMGVEEPKYKVDLKQDDLVKISDGPLKGFEGKVTEVDEDKGKIKVTVSMFGRETPVSLDFLQVKKM